jgi:hypothetical protein
MCAVSTLRAPLSPSAQMSPALAAATGASLKELMARLGHSSMRAAMIYQHATRDRDEAIAKALGGLMHQVRSDPADQVGEGP